MSFSNTDRLLVLRQAQNVHIAVAALGLGGGILGCFLKYTDKTYADDDSYRKSTKGTVVDFIMRCSAWCFGGGIVMWSITQWTQALVPYFEAKNVNVAYLKQLLEKYYHSWGPLVGGSSSIYAREIQAITEGKITSTELLEKCNAAPSVQKFIENFI